jgi:hypothetical protein
MEATSLVTDRAGDADNAQRALALVHLVWGPLGTAPLRRFLDSYGAHPAHAAHDLVVLANGVTKAQRPQMLAELDRVEHRLLEIEQPVLDLSAYRLAVTRLEHRHVCFANSYSQPLVDGWLAKLVAPLAGAEVGLTGIGGSYESAYSAAPFWLRARRRRAFEPFPNPHLRTNGFAIARELLLDLDWPSPRSKASALALESGKRSLSRQLWERGLSVLVVGRDGASYEPELWPRCATFRAGVQRNLLIADNRTRQYEDADARLKSVLERMAWGEGQVSLPEWAAPARRVTRR